MKEDMHKYDDIIGLPRHVSERHPAMAVSDRAAQFSPFSALSGYGETVREAARRTDEKMVLDPEEEELINETLLLLQEGMAQGRQVSVSVTYFVKDAKKTGGSYQKAAGILKKIDSDRKQIILGNGEHILFENIVELDKDFNF